MKKQEFYQTQWFAVVCAIILTIGVMMVISDKDAKQPVQDPVKYETKTEARKYVDGTPVYTDLECMQNDVIKAQDGLILIYRGIIVRFNPDLIGGTSYAPAYDELLETRCLEQR